MLNFFGKAIFRDTVIKGVLNLRDTIFDDEANFLDITFEKENKNENGEFIGEIKDIRVANRETARIIKNFYDSSNNVIEANRFYKLEMQKREKELVEINKHKKTTKEEKRKNLFELFVFKAHGIASNHSQDWVLPLYWILIFGIGTALLNHSIDNGFWSIFTSIIFAVPIFISSLSKLYKFGLFYFLYVLKTEDIFLNCIIKVINPFQKFDGGMTTLDFIAKVIIAYLIYQLIISIRQNTRRK